MIEYKVQAYKDRTVWLNQEGELHREDGPAYEEPDGYKSWYVNGKLHRVDGPAIEWDDGYREWYIEGKCHRLNGPAVEFPNGYKEWWIEGVEYSEQEFNKKIKELKANQI